MLSNVFGTKPENSIFNPAAPFAVRFNCQTGQLALSETEFIGNSAEISIIKVARYFGDLGNTKRSEWLQVFYIAAPSCAVLPSHTVCCSYIKTRSLSAFQQGIIKLIGEGVNPAEGIFKISFVRHSSGDRNYFSVKFDWRARQGEAEITQLEMITAFLADEPALLDMNGTREMINVDDLPSVVIQQLVDQARFYPDLSPAELLQGLLEPIAQQPAPTTSKRKRSK